jgi:hypothetical protein
MGSAQYQTARATLSIRLASATSTERVGTALLQVAPPLPSPKTKGAAGSTASSNTSVASTLCGIERFYIVKNLTGKQQTACVILHGLVMDETEPFVRGGGWGAGSPQG